nr:MAG TPA_asm: hypothetical protein [Caudoviricetes sp.]
MLDNVKRSFYYVNVLRDKPHERRCKRGKV